MANTAPGKYYRKGISFKEFFRMFPDDAASESWFVAHRWTDGIRCPRCKHDSIQTGCPRPCLISILQPDCNTECRLAPSLPRVGPMHFDVESGPL